VLLGTVEGFPESHNDRWCVHVFVSVWPAFGEQHIDIIVIDLGVEKCGDYVQAIDDPSTSSDRREEISKGS